MPELPISQVWIDRVKVDKGREIYYDTTQRGLALRVSYTGKKVWQVSYRVPGDRTKQVYDLGPYSKTHLGIAEARKRANDTLDGVRHGIDPKVKAHVESQARDASPSLEQLADQYIERYAKAKGKRSWDRDLELLNRHIIPKVGTRKAHEIRKREFIEILEGIARHGAKGIKGAPIAANRTLAVLKTMYKWANRVDLLDSYDPVRDIDKPSPEKPRERVLLDDEIRKVWAVLDDPEQLTGSMGPAFKMRLITGQRSGEIQMMRWQDITGDWWTIPGEHRKNKKSHRIPLTSMAQEILAIASRDNDWVFPNPKTGDYVKSYHKRAEVVEEKSGVNFVMHDFRRTVASHLAMAGIDDKTIERVLGHTEKGVTDTVYIHYKYDREKRDALEVWDSKLQEILRTPG